MKKKKKKVAGFLRYMRCDPTSSGSEKAGKECHLVDTSQCKRVVGVGKEACLLATQSLDISIPSLCSNNEPKCKFLAVKHCPGGTW